MKNRKKFITTLLTILVTILIFISSTYAFFELAVNNDNRVTAELITKNLSLVFTDGPEIVLDNVLPGQTIIKTFSVENTRTETLYYSIYLNDVINTFTRNTDLVYTLTSTNDGAIIGETEFPKTSKALYQNIEIPVNTTQEYTLTITYKNLNEDQSADMGKMFSGTIQLVAGVKTYNLTGYAYDNNGDLMNSGTVEVHSDVISAPIQSDGSFTLVNVPIGDHEIIIKDSSNTIIAEDTFKLETRAETNNVINNEIKLEEEIKTLAISVNNKASDDVEIKILGNLNTVDLTINNGYSSSPVLAAYSGQKTNVVTISPEEHYHFKNITCDNNIEYTLSENQLYVNSLTTSGACTINYEIDTVTINFVSNNGTLTESRKVINYSEDTSVVNTPNVGYKLGSVSCTNNQVATNNGNTINVINVTMDTTCTIGNVKDVFRVDVNPVINGTTYTSGKDGFTFNIWVDDDLRNGNIIDYVDNLPYESKVRVKANSVAGYTTSYDQTYYVGTSELDFMPSWTANSYILTFNANGGSISFTSKSVTYDSQIGNLPTGTKANAELTGFFTSSSGGTKVINTNIYKTAGNSTLYAQWQSVQPPVISGGSNSWVTSATVKVSTAGSAFSGVKNYEYYVSTSSTKPSDSTAATGTGSSVNVTSNGTYYVFFRTISNNGIKSSWTNAQTVKVDNTIPSISINSGVPASVTKGDSYVLLGSYGNTGSSGVSASCSSNINGTVTNTSQLSVGTHTITCTAKTGANKTNSVSKTVKITYTQYSITNMVTNGSFEGNLNGWDNLGSVSYVSNSVHKYGSYSYLRSAATQESAMYIRQSLNFTSGHKYYFFLYGYNPSSTSQRYCNDINSRGGGITLDLIASNGWTKGGAIYNCTITEQRSISVNFCTTTADTYIDGVGMIDLTATFGAGNEPDLNWCNNHINFFNGTSQIYK